MGHCYYRLARATKEPSLINSNEGEPRERGQVSNSKREKKKLVSRIEMLGICSARWTPIFGLAPAPASITWAATVTSSGLTGHQPTCNLSWQWFIQIERLLGRRTSSNTWTKQTPQQHVIAARLVQRIPAYAGMMVFRTNRLQ